MFQVLTSENPSFWQMLRSPEQRFSATLIIVFSVITLVVTTAFIMLLMLHLRQKRKIYKDSLADLNITARTVGSESQWSGIFVDQKCRPVLRYVPTTEHIERPYATSTMLVRPVTDLMEDSQGGLVLK